ncbi:hypothetical protein MKW92_002042 [Papaver armeniacum]|nr:hypothetical protein MKW92_002042 [Papaver armeniacum]
MAAAAGDLLVDNESVVGYMGGRPKYPAEWYQVISQFTAGHSRAWDAGTEHGIAALGIADYYDQVIATDINKATLQKAVPHPKVTYIHTPVSMSDEELISNIGGEASVDLITVAHAIQFFDLPRFYSLVDRVLKPDGVIVVWGYNDIRVVSDSIHLLWKRLHESALPYRSANVRDISDGFESLPFPFEAIGIGWEGKPIDLIISTVTTFQGFLDMLRVWPDVVAAKDHGIDLLSGEVIEKFQTAWGDSPSPQPVLFKTFMIAGSPKLQKEDATLCYGPPLSRLQPIKY